MTKAEENRLRIREDKANAFARKVRTLLGHVSVDNSTLRAAFDAGKEAEPYAAEVAAKEPVGAALHDKKADAVKSAGEDARVYVGKVREDLIKHGWDLNAAAPYPYREHGYQADAKKLKHNNYSRLTTSDPAKGYQSRRMNNDPHFVIMDDASIERFVEQAERAAAMYYDAFICKMVAKVGVCDEAKCEGNHVWSHSILTVTKGSTVERWKTQQIINVSKLGLHFPQWPSRLMK
jgi:hypothetical protein